MVTGFLTVLLALTLITHGAGSDRCCETLLLALFPSLAVIIFVLFQPELRRMLAQLGNLPFFASVREQRENIEVIIKTVERLADVRIGMLVADRAVRLRAGGGRVGHRRGLRGHPGDAGDDLLPEQCDPRRRA